MDLKMQITQMPGPSPGLLRLRKQDYRTIINTEMTRTRGCPAAIE